MLCNRAAILLPKPKHYWDEAQELYSTGSYPEACGSFEEAYNKLPYNGLLMQSYGKSLAMCAEFKKGIVILENAQRYTSDEVLYTTIGDCYKALQQYPQAETAYLCATYMVPHKLYPHYLLAKLYAQSGNTEKALKKANDVLDKKAKVESIAEVELKVEMKTLIDSLKN